MVDAHTVATFAFAQLRRDPDFAKRFPWLRNTVVCIESDRVSVVMDGLMSHHFPEGGTVACYYPQGHRFMFIKSLPARQSIEPGTVPVVANDPKGELTMGMIIDAMYSKHVDWDTEALQIGEASTLEVEKRLSLVK